MPKQKTDLTAFVCFCLIAFLLLGILGRILGYEIRKDEHLYVAPATLLSDLSLYKDFFYNHVPASAWYFFGLSKVTGGNYPFLTSRLGVFIAWLVLTSAVYFFNRKLTGSRFLGYFAAITILGNGALHSQAGMAATNNLLPMPLLYIGLALFCIAVLQRSNGFWIVLVSGLCLSLAAATKASAIVFVLPVGLAAFFLPLEFSFSQRFKYFVIPLIIGGLIGATPVFIYLFSNTEQFLSHVVKFHVGPHIAYWHANMASEPDLAFYLKQKVILAFSVWFMGANLLLLFVCCFFAVQRKWDGKAGKFLSNTNTGLILMVLGCLVLSTYMSFVPTPSFPQYYIQAIVCLPLLMALLFNGLELSQKEQAYPIFTTIIILVVLASIPRVAQGYITYAKLNKSTVFQVHKGGVNLKTILEREEVTGKVATLASIYPLETGMQVYPEFATGEFAYRIGPYIASELQNEYTMTTPMDVETFLRNDPPAAILVGFNQRLEAPMVEFAISHNYKLIGDIGIKNRYGKGVLYLKSN